VISPFSLDQAVNNISPDASDAVEAEDVTSSLGMMTRGVGVPYYIDDVSIFEHYRVTTGMLSNLDYIISHRRGSFTAEDPYHVLDESVEALKDSFNDDAERGTVDGITVLWFYDPTFWGELNEIMGELEQLQ